MSRSLLFTALCVAPLPYAVADESATTTDNTSETSRLPAPESQLPLEELRRFTEVFARIKNAYVEEVSDSTLLNNAIKGMLSGLDPHSTYMEPKAFDDLQENTSGEFGGVGIEVGLENGFIKVISPIDDTPATKAGIEAGDLIIKLNGENVKGMSLEEAIKKMRGKPGSKLMLTIVREGESAPLEKEVIRDYIQVASVKQRTLGGNIGYVRITQFQANTGPDFKKSIKKLKEETDGKLAGLVIDLRNNPGGVLQAAVDVADSLLEEGLIVYTEGRIKSSQLRFSATPGDLTDHSPIAVLINGGSASASEILAGALQDHHRAIIMGTDSFGKGSVQTVMPLNEGFGLKLTTARYYTPSGRSIQALGITPDVEVKRAKLTELNNQPIFKEANLSRHLSNDTTTEQEPAEGDSNKKAPEQKILEKDFQLREAVNLLKGLSIYAQGQKQAS